jgi:hypothetical protein
LLKVINIRVGGMVPFHTLVTWKTENSFDDPLDFDMRMMRSESQGGPFEYVSQPFVDKYQYIDGIADLETRAHRLLWYQIEVTERKTGTKAVYGPAGLSAPPDLQAMEMRRQAMLIYQTVAGRRCWLFPVRTFGQRCKNCYDPVTDQPVKTRCLTCYDTTWTRGYMDPIEVWVQFEPTPKQMASNLIRVEKMQGQKALCGYYPEIKPLDMLVEPENRRWIVQNVVSPERLRSPVRQQLTLDEIELGHVNYEVPLNVADLLQQDNANPWLFHPSRSLGLGIPWSS